MSRLRSGMSLGQKAAVFADGNMGALSVALMLSGLSEDYFNLLDELDIVGTDLYLLFGDVCERNVKHLGALLFVARAGALGLDRDKLIYAANNRGSGVDVSAAVAYAVKAGRQFDHLF